MQGRSAIPKSWNLQHRRAGVDSPGEHSDTRRVERIHISPHAYFRFLIRLLKVRHTAPNHGTGCEEALLTQRKSPSGRGGCPARIHLQIAAGGLSGQFGFSVCILRCPSQDRGNLWFRVCSFSVLLVDKDSIVT